jgi:ABC-type branched-subunit amino acid transport system substrate-binding protein
MILKLKSAGVDLVYVDAVDPDILTFVNQAKQLGFTPRIMMETSVKDTLATPGVHQSLLDGIVVLDWDITPPSFAQKFEALYRRAPDNSANRAYDATYILADAIAKNNGGSSLASILESTQFTTPNGPFAFTADHAASDTPVAIEVIKNGQVVAE